MATSDERLRRLIAEEVGECCAGDVEDRLDGLATLTETIPADPSSDLSVLKALGSETRYRIVRLLVAAEDELCVCELNPLLEVSDSAVSHALSDLADADLVEREKRGTWRYYRPTERAVAIVEALDETREEIA